MKRYFLLMSFLCISVFMAFASPTATLSDIKGKVEIKPAGKSWTPATEGMAVDLATTVSTGFDATATLKIDNSTIAIKPLTRITLDKLLEQSSGSVAASMFLRVGSVNAKVKASVPGVPQDFKVQSPYSTASVRGTEFNYNGLKLEVVEGIVRLIPGRPKRDKQPAGEEGVSEDSEESTDDSTGAAGDDGFEGAVDVGDADESEAVSVGMEQQATMQIAYRLDAGTQAPTVNQAGKQESAATAVPVGSKPVSIPENGGVTITITDE